MIAIYLHHRLGSEFLQGGVGVGWGVMLTLIFPADTSYTSWSSYLNHRLVSEFLQYAVSEKPNSKEQMNWSTVFSLYWETESIVKKKFKMFKIYKNDIHNKH